MEISKCEVCSEPSKFINGFADGINNAHGCIFDCSNTMCKEKLKRESLKASDILNRQCV
jgi:SUMO ligase MMS21 Smc5/6 complex component